MKVCNTLEKYKMISKGERVLCALSGGMDSVVLTHYLAANAKNMGITVCAAHFSHGIRKDAAQSEMQLCISLCQDLGIELICGEGDAPARAHKSKIGIEQAARELRYDFLRDAASKLGADKIATAHHMNDNVETVIMNACRGASVKGMCGIPTVRDEFIRPLIDTSRCEIEKYAGEHGLAYATDATNFELCCRRNAVRLQLLPEMRKLYPDVDMLLNRFSAVARLYNQAVQCQAQTLVSTSDIKNGEVTVNAADLTAADEAVASRAFELLCRLAGADGMLSNRHIRALHKICRSADPSASVDLPGARAFRRYDKIVFAKPVSKSAIEDKIIGIDSKIRFGDWEVQLADGSHPGGLWLDKNKLSLPLVVRSRREGDRIFINGIHKSVKKLMIDQKIPKEMRDNIPVLVDNNKIVAIAGICHDRSYAADKETNIISLFFRRV